MQNGFMEDMGERLGKIRKDSGLNQVPFAEELEVSQSAYNTYERGNREIPMKLLRLLYIKFNVNPTWMLTGQGSPYNRDNFELYHAIVATVDTFIANDGSQVEVEKRKKLIRFLMDHAEEQGDFNEDSAKKYLRSAL